MRRPEGMIGLGLRSQHYPVVLEQKPAVAWFEAITENFMFTQGRPRHVIERVRADYPLALHGVSLSIGTAGELDANYVTKLAAFVREIDPFIVSDHLCWTGAGGHNTHDLLPLPMNASTIDLISSKVQKIQESLGRRLVLENISTYVTLKESDLSEAEFLNALCKKSGCGLLLDVNNVYVNAFNHGFDPYACVSAIDARYVEQLHAAGHTDKGDYLFDTHQGPITAAVWELYAHALKHVGAKVPTLIEWDTAVPPFEELLNERDLAQGVYDGVFKK